MGEPSFMISTPCKTEHPQKQGPAACTSCPDGISFTVVDPRTFTGTCTEKPCPFCKPKACCGANHKHYVMNTESLEGVCVRHTDDCTPLCVPQGVAKPGQRRICSKGCNQLIKLPNPGAPSKSTHESKLYSIVVCQLDKRGLRAAERCRSFGLCRGRWPLGWECHQLQLRRDHKSVGKGSGGVSIRP